MDINNLLNSNYYSDFLKTQESSATDVKNAAKSVGKDSTDEELMGVCKQFESYLLEQVFKEMQKTVSFDDKDESSIPGLGTGSSNQLVDYFKDQTIAKLAEQSTEKSGLGLAQMLYDSMKRQQ